MGSEMCIRDSPGTIDSDYRGELGVILFNTGTENYRVSHGDRIAQIIVSPVVKATFAPVKDLNKSSRGGFGSTGNK